MKIRFEIFGSNICLLNDFFLILYYTIDESIGKGYLNFDSAMDLPCRKVEDYVVWMRKGPTILVKTTMEFLKEESTRMSHRLLQRWSRKLTKCDHFWGRSVKTSLLLVPYREAMETIAVDRSNFVKILGFYRRQSLLKITAGDFSCTLFSFKLLDGIDVDEYVMSKKLWGMKKKTRTQRIGFMFNWLEISPKKTNCWNRTRSRISLRFIQSNQLKWECNFIG